MTQTRTRTRTRGYWVRMTDSFMSGWGQAKDKTNVLVIECDTLEQAEQIERAARVRNEMKRVAVCSTRPKDRAGVVYSWKHYDDMGGAWKPSNGGIK